MPQRRRPGLGLAAPHCMETGLPVRCTTVATRSVEALRNSDRRGMPAAAHRGDRTPAAALFVLVLNTGIRECELLGLQWRDIHLIGRHFSTR